MNVRSCCDAGLHAAPDSTFNFEYFGEKWRAPEGWKPVYTTVRYLVVQPFPRQKPFMAFGNVPIADTSV